MHGIGMGDTAHTSYYYIHKTYAKVLDYIGMYNTSSFCVVLNGKGNKIEEIFDFHGFSYKSTWGYGFRGRINTKSMWELPGNIW